MVSDSASCGPTFSPRTPSESTTTCILHRNSFCLYGCRLASALVCTVPKYIYWRLLNPSNLLQAWCGIYYTIKQYLLCISLTEESVKWPRGELKIEEMEKRLEEWHCWDYCGWSWYSLYFEQILLFASTSLWLDEHTVDTIDDGTPYWPSYWSINIVHSLHSHPLVYSCFTLLGCCCLV